MTTTDGRKGKPGDLPERHVGTEKGLSTGRMHENVPDWSDPVCSGEAEPYWQDVAEEVMELMGKRDTKRG